MIKADLKTVKAVHSGMAAIKAIYSGSKLVWKKGAGFSSPYNREVEYLLATDTDTNIVTDIVLDDLTRYDIEIKGWCGLGSTMLFGVRDIATTGNTNAFAMIHSTNGQYQLRIQGSASSFTYSANNTLPHVFRWSGTDRALYVDEVKVNGSVTLSQAQGVKSSFGLGLFGCHSGGFVDNMGKERCIYYFKVECDGELIADYIPVIDNNGIPCFFDKVTEKLIRCSGIGTFGFAEKEEQE